MSAASSISEWRAAGFTEGEIKLEITPEVSLLRAAGFTQDEIAEHFEAIKREYKAVCRQFSVIQEDVAALAEIESNPRLFDVSG